MPEATRFISEPQWTEPQPGEIRQAIYQNEEEGVLVVRLVLVHSVSNEPFPWVNAAMVEVVSNFDWKYDPTVIGPMDLYLDKTETGLEHSIIIETDVMGMIETSTLSPVVARLDDTFMNWIDQMVIMGTQPKHAFPRFGPLWTEDDPRMKYKEQDLDQMEILAGDTLFRLAQTEMRL